MWKWPSSEISLEEALAEDEGLCPKFFQVHRGNHHHYPCQHITPQINSKVSRESLRPPARTKTKKPLASAGSSIGCVAQILFLSDQNGPPILSCPVYIERCCTIKNVVTCNTRRTRAFEAHSSTFLNIPGAHSSTLGDSSAPSGY